MIMQHHLPAILCKGRYQCRPNAPSRTGYNDFFIRFPILHSLSMDAGVEPGDMMDDPRWEDLNERAVAAELNAWALFVEMTGQQG